MVYKTQMLSALSRISLSNSTIFSTPVTIPSLKICELSQDDCIKFFGCENEELLAFDNGYYCKVVLKLSTAITASFESDYNYVI